MDSIYTGVSGMLAQQKAISVIGNNIANMGTVAFKANRVSFEETLVQTLNPGVARGTNPMQLGRGVGVASIDTVMTAGSLRQTSRPLDLAVVGNGFFIVNDGTSNHYTRAGVMQLDGTNRLVMASNGMQVVGWAADLYTGAMDTTSAPQANLSIPLGTLYAVPTGNVNLGGNLNAAADIGSSAHVTFDTYDSLGSTHQVTVTFTKTGAGTWGWSAASADGTVTIPGGSTLTFDEHGSLTTPNGTVNLTLTSPNGATSPLTFNINFGTVSQLDGSNSVQTTSQDGLPMGTLENYSIDASGRILGSFSNGASRLLGQLALANFTNPAGLLREGNNLWQKSSNSGEPVAQTAEVGGNLVRSGFLEMSNVDLTSEFTDLIVAQRGFQANSRSITTADDLLQEVLQIKR